MTAFHTHFPEPPAAINGFLLYLRTDYRPHRLNGDDRPLSSQSIYNTWTALKAFTRWAHETLAAADVEDAHRRASPVDRWLK